MKRLLLLFGLLLPALGFAQQYTIGWYKIAGGGGASSGGVYSVNGTIGQPDAGAMSGNGYTLEGGFWSVLATVQGSGPPPLTIQPTATNTIVISWPANAGDWVLQESATGAAGTWSNVSTPPVLVDGTMQVILPASESANQFRLVAAPTAPQLVIADGATNSVVISWPAPSAGWVLQENSTLAGNSWTNSTSMPVPVGGSLQVTVSPPLGSKFYRLKK